MAYDVKKMKTVNNTLFESNEYHVILCMDVNHNPAEKKVKYPISFQRTSLGGLIEKYGGVGACMITLISLR